MRAGALCLVLSVAHGCASNGTSFVGYCALSKPILLSDKAIDALSEEEAATIGTHNDTWIKHCQGKG